MERQMNKKEFAKVCYPNDKRMQDFIEKNTFEVVELSKGSFGLDKEKVKKDFCFGYGECGYTTEEDIEQAEKMSERAKQADYFMEKNLESLNEKIKVLKLALKKDNLFELNNRFQTIVLHERYINNSEVINWAVADSLYVKDIITKETICKSYVEKNFRNSIKINVATKKDIQTLLEAYNRQKENFTKRLNTWWKKYGAEKLNTWTYLVD